MSGSTTMRSFLASVESRATKFRALSSNPPILVSGSGSWLTDDTGRRYLDFGCGSAVNNLGHDHPALREAIVQQLGTGLLHAGPHFQTEIHVRYYEKLRSLLPTSLSHFHPATNGTEAIEVALKMAQLHTGGSQFISFRGSYHGRTRGSLAVSAGKAANAALGVTSPAAAFFQYPRCASCTRRKDGSGCCGFAQTELEDVLDEPKNGLGKLAGIIVEPVQGTGGLHVPPVEFLHTLRSLATDLGVPLIFDEVFTNGGRTGRFFAFEHFGVTPDILCMGKMITAGVPGACVAVTAEINDGQAVGSQTSTFQLGPLSAAAGLAGMRILLEEDLLDRAAEIHVRTIRALAPLLSLPTVRDVRGIGAMNGIEIVDAESGRPDTATAKQLRARLLENGLITYECGSHNHVIGLLPPLVITEEELDQGFSIISEALLT